jgi:hypothetical protein
VPALRAVGQLGGHPVLVLAQPDQFAADPDLGPELGGAHPTPSRIPDFS